jgi:hypothetical protein
MALQLVTDSAPASGGPPIRPGEAAQTLADFHREIAAKLPPTSKVRAAALRCATQWDKLAILGHSEGGSAQ